MTFEELKAEILNRAKRLELCESYQQALVAEDYASLIQSSVSLIEWTFQSGVVDATLIEEFPEEDLQAAGIYKSDAVIDDPIQFIYLLKGNFTVNITGNNYCRVRVLNDANVTVNLQGNGYLECKAFDEATVTMILSGTSSLTFELVQGSTMALQMSGGTASNGKISDASALSIVASDTSFSSVKAFNDSAVNYAISDGAEVDVKLYQNATVNAVAT